MHVRDIVERELQTKTDGVGYDVKLKLGIKKKCLGEPKPRSVVNHDFFIFRSVLSLEM